MERDIRVAEYLKHELPGWNDSKLPEACSDVWAVCEGGEDGTPRGVPSTY